MHVAFQISPLNVLIFTKVKRFQITDYLMLAFAFDTCPVATI